MNTSPAAMQSSVSVAATPQFWERLWRTAGIQSIALFLGAYLLCGYAPGVNASDEVIVSFYQTDHLRILIATVVGGLAVLNLMWFVAALRSTLAAAGQDGWGAAATASSAALASFVLLGLMLVAAFSYAPPTAANPAVLRGANDILWAALVLGCFPRAMVTMAAAFGLWRAQLISNRLFAVGVAAVVLSLLGGTTWMQEGWWAPDGVYARFIAPGVSALWILVVSQILLSQKAAAHSGW